MMIDIKKTKLVTCGDKVSANFHGLNMPEVTMEWKSFTVVSVDLFACVRKKYYLQVYLDNCAYNIENKQMADYLNDNLFED